MLVLHCGGNDVGQYSVADLRHYIKSQICYLKKKLPNTKIVWSQILPRGNWRYSDNAKAMNRVRIRLNSAVATEAIRLNGGYIKYPDLVLSSTALWSVDGVHLSDLGNDLFLNTLQSALESMLFTDSCIYPISK